MQEILLSVKSQLTYVIENQYRLTSDSFLYKYHTPPLDIDLLDEYLSVISNDIVEKLELNYEKISAKSQYILNKFPSNETLTEEERVDISNQLIIFIKEELPQVLFNKISDNILN